MRCEITLAMQRQLVEALRNPACYPHPVDKVTLIETHISFVLLTGSFAYKIKKAVDLGFVDYTTLARRRLFCEEELRLNRRLAPGLYLDVVGFRGTPENPRFCADCETIEYAVKMAEFSQQDLLAAVLARNALTGLHVDRLARRLAAFHMAAPAVAAQAGLGSAQAVCKTVEDNFACIIERHADPRLAVLHGWCTSGYARLRDRICQRRADGWVRECHGDLHLGNLVLVADEPQAFDCIEFSDELRWIDVISDLAFLVMDLAVHGRPDYGRRLLTAWLEITGDYEGLVLLNFYQAYRALVRAKVALLRANGLQASAGRSSYDQATVYLDHAFSLMTPPRPALLVTHGFSGSGKTALARRVAEQTGPILLRSDVERKRLHGLAPLANSNSAPDAGIYSGPATRATYDRLARLAAMLLDAGHAVIIDAACLLRWQREHFLALARQASVPVLILDCQAPPATLRLRVSQRTGDASEAGASILDQQLKTAELLSPAEQSLALAIDTTSPVPDRLIAEIGLQLERCQHLY